MQTTYTEDGQLFVEDEPVAKPLVNLDPIGQLVRDGDVRSDKSEQHAEEAKKALALADDYSDKARKLQQASNDMLISAGLCYIEAQAKAQLAGRLWLEVLAEFSRYTRQHVARCIKIAKSSNPKRAAEEYRARTKADVNKHRKKSEDGTYTETVSSISQPDDVEFDPLEGGALSTEVEANPLLAIHRHRCALTFEQFGMDLRASLNEAKKLGYMRSGILEIVDEIFPAPKPNSAPSAPSPRVERAVALFFELPAAKHLWVKQRMAEPLLQTFRNTGPHVEWVQTFWQCSKEEQDAIREQIKITEQRNAA